MAKYCQVCGLKTQKKSNGMWFYRPRCASGTLPKDFHFCKDHAKEYWALHDSLANIKVTLTQLKSRHKRS